MYSHVACDVMKELTLYLLKPSSLIWLLMPYLFLFIRDRPFVFLVGGGGGGGGADFFPTT